jgi:hypothetical protein
MKKKANKPAVKAAPTTDNASSNKLMYIVLFAVAVLIIIAIVISMKTDSSDATAWATVRSRELHGFMSNCRDNGGAVDVRQNAAPAIVFVCEYLDRSVEYTLQPGK